MIIAFFQSLFRKLTKNSSNGSNKTSQSKTISNSKNKTTSTFALSERSQRNLEGVHPDLQAIVKRAIELTEIDFAVTEGVRSFERQEELFDKGATTTMNSRHLTGHAVDVVAYIGTDISWSMPLYFKIADAFREAAIGLEVPIEWGCAWRRQLNSYSSAKKANMTYVDVRRKQGKRPFLDGPHMQLPWRSYPA